MANNRDQSSHASSGRATIFFRRLRHNITSTKVRAPIIWWRHLGLKSQDVILGSYPRSGSTWLRFTLFEILTGKPSSFDSVNSAFRGLKDHRQGWHLLPGDGRFIGTHEPYRASYRRAVYLVRDVRDVVLSEFAFEQNLGIGRQSLDDYLQDFVGGHKRHGSWQNHVQSWLDSPLATSGDLLVIRYEDLRQDSVETFMKIADFLGMRTDRNAVEIAVANNSLKRMREKEDRLYQQENYSAVPSRPVKSVQPGGRFIRSGKMGGWQEQLSQGQLQVIERHCGSVLLRLQYPVVTMDSAASLAANATPVSQFI
jgi:Sulfotransferase domain